MDSAAPVDRSARLPCITGHGSRCSSPRRSVRDMSHAESGWMNLRRTTSLGSCKFVVGSLRLLAEKVWSLLRWRIRIAWHGSLISLLFHQTQHVLKEDLGRDRVRAHSKCLVHSLELAWRCTLSFHERRNCVSYLHSSAHGCAPCDRT